MAQLGISTTAGHDCFFNESFPMVFARHFGAVCRPAQSRLEPARSPSRYKLFGARVGRGLLSLSLSSLCLCVEKHVRQVLATQRVGLRMRNHAIGNDGAMPSHGCAPTIVGHDNDVVGWDYSMMVSPKRFRVSQSTHPCCERERISVF